MAYQYLNYEYPLTERLRTFLRAEYLFQLTKHRLANLENPWDTKDCVAHIIESYNLIERTEFRSELLKELERHGNYLQRLSHTPSVDHRALEKVIRDLEKSADIVRNTSAKPGFFPNSDLLNSVRQRLSIPGGHLSFDLPLFHYWLHLPAKTRQSQIHHWMDMLEPLEKALNLVLDLTRQSSMPTREMATGGIFQKSLNTQSTCQLIRLNIRSDQCVFPEISGNKHRINIRFLMANPDLGKAALVAQDIPFELTCCAI